MKRFLPLASLVLALGATLSCEQQSWDQTKMFKQTRHADHGTGHGSGHGDAPAAGHGTSAPAPAAH